MNVTVGGAVIINGSTVSQSNPQYYVSWAAAGSISGGVLTYTGSVHAQNLPFGDVACNIEGAFTISSTTMFQSGPLSGSGSCPSYTATTTLTNLTGTQGGPPPCPTCYGTKSSENLPANPSNLPGSADQQKAGGLQYAGDPIDVGTGNVMYSVNDYATAGPNVLALNRYYNSQPAVSTYATELGPQWRTNYDRYLQVAPTYLAAYALSPGTTSNLVAERPDGSQMIFFLTGGAYWTDTTNDATLTVSGSTYTLTLHDDTVETYTASGGKGVLSSIKYRGGYTQTLAYNGSGQLSTVTDSYGRVLTFTYTGSQLTQVTTPDSLVLTYGFTGSCESI